MPEPFQFPAPRELEPLPPYRGVDVLYDTSDTYGDMGEVLDGQTDEPGVEESTAHKRPFEPYDLQLGDSSGEADSVYINDGYLIHTHVQNAGYSGGTPATSAAKLEHPVINGESINESGFVETSSGDAWVRPRLDLPAATCWIYLYFHTDEHGHISDKVDSSGASGTEAVQVIASATEKVSVHHVPPDDTGVGGEGDYYIQIAKTTDDGAGNPVLVHEGRQDNFLWQEAFVLKNVGSQAEVFKEFNPDTDTLDLRSIDGSFGINAVEATDDIDLDFDGDSVGSGEDVFLGELHADNTGAGKAEFRTIDGDTSRGQIEVVRLDAGTLAVRGNGKSGSMAIERCDGTPVFTLTWADGLITNVDATNVTIDIPECPTTT